MAQDIEKLIVQMSADIRAFQKEMAKVNGIAARTFREMEKRGKEADKRLAAGFGNTAASIKRAMGGVAAALGTAELVHLADEWTQMNNILASASQATGMQARSLSELRKSADDARSALEPYVELYATLMRSASGVLQTETKLAEVTNIITKAFAASGASARDQEAAVLQLSHALNEGYIQGQQLLSLEMFAPVIMRAVAKEFGTTVAGLKKLGSEGKITTDRFVKGVVGGGKEIEAQFRVTKATIADAYKVLHNNLTEFVGKAGQSSGAAKAMTEALFFLAENINLVGTAAGGVAAILATVFVGKGLRDAYRGIVFLGEGAKDTAVALRGLATAGSIAAAPFGALAAVVGGALVYGLYKTVESSNEASQKLSGIDGILSDLGVTAKTATETLEDGLKKVSSAADEITGKIKKLQEAYEVLKRKSESWFAYPVERKRALKDMADIEEALKRLGATTGTTNKAFGAFTEGLQTYVDVKYIRQDTFDQFIAVLDKVKSGGIDAANAIAELKKIASGDFHIENLIRDLGVLEAVRNEAEQVKKVVQSAGLPRKIIEDNHSTDDKAKKSNAYDNAIKNMRQRIELLNKETEVQRSLNPFVNDYGFALEKVRAYQTLLNAAKEAGLKIDTATIQAMQQLATVMAEAQAESARVAEAQEKIRAKLQEVKDVSHDVTRTFIDSMIDGKNATEALGDAISRLGQRLLDAGLDALFDNIFKAGSSGGSGWLGKIFGYSSGGYTGPGGKYQPAGMVHKGEVVWSQDDVKRWGGPQIVEAMRKGYASGGIVGFPAISPPQIPTLVAKPNSNNSGDRRIQVNVTPSPYFNVRVTEISRQETASGVKEYDKTLNKTIGIKMSNARNLNRSGF